VLFVGIGLYRQDSRVAVLPVEGLGTRLVIMSALTLEQVGVLLTLTMEQYGPTYSLLAKQ